MANKPAGSAEVGRVLFFRNPRSRYGTTAVVTARQTAITRPYGYGVEYLDLVTSNGTDLQWSRGEVSREFARYGGGN